MFPVIFHFILLLLTSIDLYSVFTIMFFSKEYSSPPQLVCMFLFTCTFPICLSTCHCVFHTQHCLLTIHLFYSICRLSLHPWYLGCHCGFPNPSFSRIPTPPTVFPNVWSRLRTSEVGEGQVWVCQAPDKSKTHQERKSSLCCFQRVITQEDCAIIERGQQEHKVATINSIAVWRAIFGIRHCVAYLK